MPATEFIEIVHEKTKRTTKVPRQQLRALAKEGWSEVTPTEVTEPATPSWLSTNKSEED